MVYFITMYAHGAVRHPGKPNVIGAAVCVHEGSNGEINQWERRLKKPPGKRDNNAKLTMQDMDLLSIVLALQKAIKTYNNLGSFPKTVTVICTNSQFAVDGITKRKQEWIGNGLQRKQGGLLPFRDLLAKAYALHDELERHGLLGYLLITKEENKKAIENTMIALNRIDPAIITEVQNAENKEAVNATTSTSDDTKLPAQWSEQEKSGKARQITAQLSADLIDLLGKSGDIYREVENNKKQDVIEAGTADADGLRSESEEYFSSEEDLLISLI